MKIGAVPATTDKIVIWTLMEFQKEKALSWIDTCSQKLFNGHDQVLASDRLVLVEIKHMRCTDYEAAISQSPEDVTRRQPYSQIVT